MMMASKHRNHWRALVGALAVAGLAFGLSLRLEGAAHVPSGAGKQIDRHIAVTPEEAKRADRVQRAQRLASAGEPVVYGNIADLKSGNIPTFPTIRVDYRDDEATRMRDAGLLVGPLPISSDVGGVASGTQCNNVCTGVDVPYSCCTGNGSGTCTCCTYTYQCDDGNRCTLDSCDFPIGGALFDGACEHIFGDIAVGGNAECPSHFGPLCGGCNDGVYCNGVEACCVGVDDPHTCCTGPGTGTCAGTLGSGCAPGTPPCTGSQVCSETISVSTCSNNPSQGCVNNDSCGGGTCVRYSCQDLACTSPADCHDATKVGAAFKAIADLTCNGTESCSSGACVAGSNPCGASASCYELQCSQGPGVDICITDADCLTLGTCDAHGPVCQQGRCCIGGVEPTCSQRNKRGVCGPGTTAGTQGGAACSTVADCGGRFCVAGVNGGKACTGAGDCPGSTCPAAATQCTAASTAASCDANGGVFYGTDDGFQVGGASDVGECGIFDDVQSRCPKYGSGVAPAGPYLQVLGPISNSPVVRAPFGVALQRLGDDYTLTNAGVCVGGTRAGLGCNLIGDCPGGSACNVSLTSFIEMDFLRFVGGSPALDRIAFEFYDENENFIEDIFFSGSAAFGLYPVAFDPPFMIPAKGYVVQRVATEFSPSAQHVWATTDAVDVGGNSPSVLWVNDGPAGNFSTSGRLVFEIEGAKAAGSFGACCLTNPDICNNGITRYACQGVGGHYLGNSTTCAQCNVGPSTGQYCRRCVANPGGPACNSDADCGGAPNSCTPTNSACDQTGPVATCVPEPSCAEGGCCNPTTGACTIESEASCTGGGRNYLGNGSDCDADHGVHDEGQQHTCPLPPSMYTGADHCADAIVHVITVPPLGETKVITITGDNSTASSTIADPDICRDPSDDPTVDPGWWEAFTLMDECSIVYLDLCGTFPVHQPAWPAYYDACPCGTFIGRVANPYEFPEPSGSRGSPDSRCQDDDNFWFSTGLIRAGTYYWPILSYLAGHRGVYQAHISVRACPRAACCNGETCTDDVTQFECDAMGGIFLAPPQRSPAVTGCTGTNGQPGSTCYNGSCCTGPGACEDLFNVSVPMDKDACDGAPFQGDFVGGIRCKGGSCSAFPADSCETDQECADAGHGSECLGDAQQIAQRSPCPVCEIEGVNNCQAYDAGAGNLGLSDGGVVEGGLYLADDILPAGDTLSSVCVWGSYIDGDPTVANPDIDCGGKVTSDHFRVRIFENDPATGRSPLPGPPWAERNARSEKGLVPDPFTLLTAYGFQLVLTDTVTGLDSPITGFNTTGDIYWLEVSNSPVVPDANPNPPVDSCLWFWAQRNGNSSSLSFGGTDEGYEARSGVPIEMSFCTNFDLTPSEIGNDPGPCCTCDGVCTVSTYFECANANGAWDINKTNCTNPVVTCLAGNPTNDMCSNAGCTGNDLPSNCCSGAGTGTCSGPEAITDGDYIVSNQCATTDGYGPIPSDYDPVDGSQLDFDMWYTYIAPSGCDLLISECLTGAVFDSMLAVYSNCGEGAPGGCDPTICPPCPLNATLSNQHLAGLGQDETCTVFPTGGPGYWRASQEIDRDAIEGECFLLRIGSFPGSRGTALLNINCGGGTGGPAPPKVVPQSNASCTAAGVPHSCCSGLGAGTCDKTRFLSFSAPAAPTASAGETAIRIKLTSLHHVTPCYTGGPCPPFTAFEGKSVYVGEPTTYVESVANGTPFKAALTQCTPLYKNWSTVGLLHVTGSALVPSSTYTVEHLGAGCVGAEDTCPSFEPGVVFKTTRWGDVETPYNPPSATVQPDLGDIGALVNKFRSALGAPIKARALIAGSDAFGTITTLGVDLGFGHIAACVDAFRGAPYPFKMGKCSGPPAGGFSGACTTDSQCTGVGANGIGPCGLLKVGNCTGAPAAGFSGLCIVDSDCNGVNSTCTGPGAPRTCCTGNGTGTCGNGAGPCNLSCAP